MKTKSQNHSNSQQSWTFWHCANWLWSSACGYDLAHVRNIWPRCVFQFLIFLFLVTTFASLRLNQSGPSSYFPESLFTLANHVLVILPCIWLIKMPWSRHQFLTKYFFYQLTLVKSGCRPWLVVWCCILYLDFSSSPSRFFWNERNISISYQRKKLRLG